MVDYIRSLLARCDSLFIRTLEVIPRFIENLPTRISEKRDQEYTPDKSNLLHLLASLFESPVLLDYVLVTVCSGKNGGERLRVCS